MKKLFTLLFLVLCLLTAQPTLAAEVNGISDPVTYDSYQNELRESNSSSKLSGEVWTDKSVIANNGKGTNSFNIDGKKVTFDDDFVEVYSALGSNSEINGTVETPIDLVIALDLSYSMAEPVDSNSKVDPTLKRKPTKLDEMADTLNSLFERVTSISDKNKISLVVFASKAVTAIPLDNISKVDNKSFIEVTQSKIDGFTYENEIKVNYKNSKGVTKNETFGKTKNTLDGKTNFQAAYTESFNQFLNNKSGSQSTNKPKLIMLSDGVFTVSYESCFDAHTETLHEQGDSKVLILQTLMNSAYYKAKVNAMYKSPVEIINLINDFSTEDTSKERIDGLSNKDNYLFSKTPITNETLESCRQAFQEWQTKGEVTLKDSIKIGTLPSDVKMSDFLDSLNLLDTVEEVPLTEQSEVLNDILDTFFETEFEPVDDNLNNSLGETGSVSFHETIGDYMQVNLKKMILFGSEYNFKKINSQNEGSNQVDTYVPVNISGNDSKIVNSSYSNPISFNLKDIKLQVITKPDSNQELKISLPTQALPILKTSVDLNKEAGKEEYEEITSVYDNRTSVNALPIRFIYGVNLRDGIRNDDNSLNLEMIDKDYLEKHQHGEEVDFFTTKYDGDSQSNTYNAESDFIPDTDNPFYIAQEDFPIFEHFSATRNAIDTPLSQIGQLNGANMYYVQKPYYYKSGLNNLKGENIESIAGQDLLNHPSSLEESEGTLMLKNGSNCIGNLRNYQTNKVNNLTQTSELRIMPSIDTTQDRPEVINYLGNNGKIALTVREIKLLITKYHSIGENLLTKDSLTVNARNIISYSLEIANATSSDANNVLVTDTIPRGLQVLNNSISNGGVLINGVLNWRINVKAHSTVTLTYQAFVIDNTVPVFENNFNISYETETGTHQETSNTVVAKLVYPQLSVEKYQASEGEVPSTTDIRYMKGGDKVIQYQFRVRNNGTGPAKDVYVYDDVPSDFVIQNNTISDNGKVENNRVSWTLDHLDPGDSKLLNFQVVIPNETPAKSWINTAFVSHSTDPTPVPSNNVKVEKTEANLSISKQQATDSSPTPTYNKLGVNSGETVTYYITVANNSNFDEYNITVTDPIPNGLLVESGSISNNGVKGQNEITWKINQLAPLQRVVLSFKCTIPDSNQISSWNNTAQLEQDGLPIEYSNSVLVEKNVVTPAVATENNNPAITNNVSLSNNNETPNRVTNNSSPNSADNPASNNPETGLNSSPVDFLIIICFASLIILGIVYMKRRKS